MKRSLLLFFCLAFISLSNTNAQVSIYNYTGASQTYTVPAGVTSINVWVWGAGGAGGDRTGGGNAGAGGSGAFLKGTLAVTPGQVLQIVVGGRGTYSTTNGTNAGGYGGGGTAYQNAGSGGGYSGIFLTTITFANARGVAGGGAGGGYGRARNFGGAGGATTGSNGAGLDATHTGGLGGTLAVGGAAGAGTGTTAGTAGNQLLGGTGGNAGAGTYGGAGAGGGYYGGGGGYGSNAGGGGGTWGSGGGGGSSYTGGLTGVTNTAGATNNAGGANNPPGIGEVYYNGTAAVGAAGDGSSGGHGLVIINATPDCSGSPVITSVSISATTGAPNSAITLSAVIPTVGSLTYQWQSGPTAAGAWTNIPGATSNPSTVYAPATLGTDTYYRLVLTCTISGLSTNSSTTLLFTTNSACNPTMAGNATYISSVSTTGYTTNINNPTGVWTAGYNNYYASANGQVTVAAGTVLRITAAIVRGNGGSNDVYETFYIDWNNDGVFDPNTEFFDAYTANTGTWVFPLNIPSDAPLGDHRLRMIADKRASAVADPCVSGTGEAEDYKITIIAKTCNTAPTSTPNSSFYYINQVAFIGTPVVPPVNSTGAGLASGYSNYANANGITAPYATQEQGEGVNVYVSTSSRAKLAAWVDWNNDGLFASPTECVYYLPDVHTGNTTFGFQIPIATTPGNYKIRIRSFNYFDDPLAPDSIITPCGAMYNGETEDYLFTVIPRCNARIGSVVGQTLCSSTAIPFTLGATGEDNSTTGFRWYTVLSGGAIQPGAVYNGGNPPTGSFTTAAISNTTIYYVSATGLNTSGAACESPRVAVTATYNTNIAITFNPSGPLYVCQGAGLSVQGGTSTETKNLINEDFESGGLGVFSVVNTTATPASSIANMQWRNRTSVFVPTYTSVWQPAISSGFGTDRFALAVSDIPGANLNTALQLTNAVSSIGFTSLTLEYDIFYDSYLGNGTDGSNPVTGYDTIRVEVSTDNVTYAIVQTFILDQGTGTGFLHQTLSLPAYINQSNLKLRFRYRANWVDGVAVDNIKLYGNTVTSSNYTWLPTGAGADINSMFLDAVYAQPYLASTNVSGIFVNPTPAQIVAGTDLNYQASLTLSNGCLATGTIVIILNDKVWEGDEDTDWHNPGNWCGDLVPIASTSVLIPAGTPNMPVISSAAALARKIEIAAGASLTINNLGTGSLSVSTDFINTGTLINNGTIILNGNSVTPQNFPGPGIISAMNTLEINNTGAGILLNNNIRIGNKLIPTAGNLSLGNSDITIGSDAGRTALVSQVGTSAGFTYGSGRFVIERYIPARRAWRLMTAPVAAGSQSINQAWQESVGGAWAANPSPGYGTHITGGTARFTVQGYDQGPLNPSIYGYTSTGWNYLPPATTELVTSNQGWMLFVRGSRAINLPLSTPSTLADITTLRPRGAIKFGTQPTLTNGTGGYLVVGNPYPSPINFKNINRTGVIGGLGGNNAYYIWDPNLGGSSGVGAFVALAWDGVKYAKSIVTGGGASIVDSTGVIPSSAAFIVNQNAGGTVVMEENDKDTVVFGNSNLFRPMGNKSVSSLRISLYGTEPDGKMSIADGTLILFNPSSRTLVDDEDVIKTTNVRENLAIVKEEHKIAIEFRNALKVKDTLFYRTWNMSRRHYEIEIALTNVQLPPGLSAFFEDTYLNQKIKLLYPDTTRIGFDITADAGSNAQDRFRIVIQPSKAAPASFTQLKAFELNSNIMMEWTVENELDIEKNEIERSEDGISFSTIKSFGEKSKNAIYNWLDEHAVTGDNFYRIKSTAITGQIKYSNKVKVAIDNGKSSMALYPNPVKDGVVNIVFNNMGAGSYTAKLYNSAGKLVFTKALNRTNRNGAETIRFNKKMAAGIYQFEITSRENGSRKTFKLIVQ